LFLLKCTDAGRSNDEQGRYTSLCAQVVRPKAISMADCHVVEYVMLDCWDLQGSYIPSGPLDLTPYPDGDAVALTVFDYGIGYAWSVRGPVLFVLKVREAVFDSSPFVGRVYITEGRDGVKLFEALPPIPRNDRIPQHAYRVSLAQLGLSAALIDCLELEGILTAADLCVRTPDELLEIRNVGKKQLQELKDRLAEAGLRPWEDEKQGAL
jgi:hypothetical protein